MISLIRHLAWNDVRSQRTPLLVWAGVLALQATVLLIDPLPESRLVTGPLIPMLRALVTATLAALFIQRDSLVGTTAFWRTRPIARGVLFASKGISAATTLVVLPWLVVFALFGSFGMLLEDAARVANAVAIEQSVITLLAAMAAAVTSSLTHLVVAGIAGSTLVTVFNLILLPAILTTWPFVGESMSGAAPGVYIATLLVLGIPAVAHQYVTLREWRTATLVACALLGATVAARTWPQDDEIVLPPPVEHAVIDPKTITAAIDPETMTVTDLNETVAGGVVRKKLLEAALAVQGQPDGVLLETVAFRSSLLLSDQTVASEAPLAFYGMAGPPSTDGVSLNTHALQSALGPSVRLSEPVTLQRDRIRRRSVVASLPADLNDRHAGERAVLTVDVTFVAYRYRVRDVRPARPGERLSFPGSGIEVRFMSTSSGGPIVVVRQAEVLTYGERHWWIRPMATPVFVLRNTARREAVGLSPAPYGPTAKLMLNFMPTVAFVKSRTWLVSASQDAARHPIDDDWLAGAELVRLELESLGTFERPLQAELTLKK